MVTTARPSWISDVVCRLWEDRGSVFDLSSQLREELSSIKPKSDELRLLAQEFFQAATMTSYPDHRMLECVKMLSHSELISWIDLLRTITGFTQFQRSRCVVALCGMLESELPHLQCSFSHISECLALTEAIIDVFVWIVEAIQAYRDLDDFEVIDVEGVLFQTFSSFLNDPFVFRLMCLATKKYAAVIKSSIVNKLYDLRYQDGTSVILNYEELQNSFLRIFDPPKLESSELSVKYNFRRSGIRSLTAVFSCFRVLAAVEEVADTMLLFGQINAISHHEIVSDMLHASFMILLEEQETRDSCKSSIEMFFYVKMPRVWAAMIRLGMKPESVVRDQHNPSNSAAAYLRKGNVRCRWRASYCTKERTTENDTRTRLFDEDDVQRQTQVAVVLSAVQARHVIDKLWNMQEKLMTVLTRLIGSGGYAFDAFCSSYGLEGTLGEMSSRASNLNLLSESPSNVCVDRNMTFDLTFTMLTRIVYKYSNLTLDELVTDPRGGPDNTACAFYQWSSRYVKRISSNGQESFERDTPLVPPELKAAYKERVLRLKERQLFWDPVVCNYGKLLHEMPIVGEVILDFFKDRKHIEEDVSRIFAAFRKANCLLVCIIQWLECQPSSEARRQMARCIRMVLEECVPDEKEEKDRWLFTRMVCRRQLEEMCECDSIIPPMTITLMAIAKRSFPILHRRQVPDKEMLKKAWLYAQRQNWAGPNVLHLIDHCNRAGAHKSWFEFYMHHMMKLRCPDVMNRAIETICACLLLEPQETLITACVLMVDFMMDKKGQVQFEVPYVIPLVKLLTQVMLMSVWIIDREYKRVNNWRNSEPKQKRARMSGEAQIHPSIRILQETVEVAINKFVKESSQGSLHQPISSVCHIVRMIASAPESEAKQLLLPYLKHLLFFQLARLEPGSISFELFSTFCDPANEDHDLEKLKFLCLLRKSGGL
uniref:Mediator of RNA polymerase II transcription subunit 24 n=1 Tax=Haemonchus contortus TaxID=6289 RepID=A0A7I4YWT1_HAECO